MILGSTRCYVKLCWLLTSFLLLEILLKPLSTTRSFFLWGDSGGILCRLPELTPTRTGDIPFGMGDTGPGTGDVPLQAGETPLCGLSTEINAKYLLQ
jgi:hypothetical protein